MSEVINEVLIWVGSIVGGVSLSAIIVSLISLIVKGGIKGLIGKLFNKFEQDHNDEAIAEKVIAQLKGVSFKQSIEPLVKSELEKINEQATKVSSEQLETLQSKYDTLIEILNNLAVYFDDAIGVSQTKKENLKQSIAKAQETQPTEVETTVVLTQTKKEEVIEETDNNTSIR